MSEIHDAGGPRKGESSAEGEAEPRPARGWLAGRGPVTWSADVCDVWTSHYRLRDPDRIDITRAGCDRLLRENKPAPGVILAPSAKLVFPALRAMKAARSEAERTTIWLDYRRAYLEELRRNVGGIWAYRLDDLLSRRRLVLVCFCADPSRCHRSLAGGFLAERGAVYRGELAS